MERTRKDVIRVLTPYFTTFQEERIATLEKRYLNAQRESTMLHDLNEKLEQELKNKDDQFALRDEKIRAIGEKLDISEQKLLDFASMPDIEEQLKDRMEALTQAQERQARHSFTHYYSHYSSQF